MADEHILLLPKQNYFRWIQAARDYAFRFRVRITHDPETAGKFQYPGQTITLVNIAGGFGRDVQPWFREHYPDAKLDVLDVTSPEELREKLAERIRNNDPFGKDDLPFRLRWPTDYALITQQFGVNADYYRRWGLPGHEGLDIRAPEGANVYAAADGTVYGVHDGSNNHPYGIHVRIRHVDGYKTIYAHLKSAHVRKDQQVSRGQVIGFADSTGNSTASHLHFSLKKEGASAAGLTLYPYDVIDPTPYLDPPDPGSVIVDPGDGGEPEPVPITYDWPYGRCLIGVHGRADGPLGERDYQPMKTARIEALKLLSNAPVGDIDRVRSDNPQIFLMTRLFTNFGDTYISASEFINRVEQGARAHYQRGIRHFEIHNEPNLRIEGWQNIWQNGREFGMWLLQVRDHLRASMPEAKFGFPGMSPGNILLGHRTQMWPFLDEADFAVQECDWVAVHAYWLSQTSLRSLSGGQIYKEYRRRYPRKLLMITEFSNPSERVDSGTKGHQYVEYYRTLRNEPGVGAAFSFVLSASMFFPYEAWRREDGGMNPKVQIIGARNF